MVAHRLLLTPANAWLVVTYPLVLYAFVPGMLLAILDVRHPIRFRWLRRWQYLALGVAFIAVGAMTTTTVPVALATGVGTVLLMGWLSHHPLPGARALAFVGGASYALYLWHKDAFITFGPGLGLAIAVIASAPQLGARRASDPGSRPCARRAATLPRFGAAAARAGALSVPVRNTFFRALLGAVAIIVLIPAVVAVGGGYLPRVSTLGPFGSVLNTGLPWVLGSAAIATACAGIAVALGGRKVVLLFALALATLIGAGNVAYRYTTVAAANGASYDIVRAIEGFPPIPEPDQELVFATVDGQDLRADLWLPSSATLGARSQPAVVFVHGGAFLAGSVGTRPLLMGALRDAGIVAIDVDYRLAPPPRWDQAPADVLCALSWLKTAPELTAVDPEKVVVVGESAGGSLALVAGFAAGTDAVPSSCPDLGSPVTPAGVVAFAPAADLAGIWDDATIYDYNRKRFPEAYIGGPPTEFPDRYDFASPFRLLRPGLPPTLIVAAETDRLVLLSRVTSIADGIRAAGSECELIVAPFTGHGFDGEPNSFGQQLTEAVVTRFVLKVTG